MTSEPRRSGEEGFTLIEVLVAMVILAVGLLGLEALGIGAARAVAMADRQSCYATLASDSLEAALHQIRQHFAGLGTADDSPRRDLNHHWCGTAACHILLTAAPAIVRLEVDLVLEGGKRIHARVDAEDHIAAMTAITTGWTAAWDKFFPAEGNRTVAPITTFDVNLDFIEHIIGFMASALRLDMALDV